MAGEIMPLSRSRSGTPIALIEAAERLFGQHGIENVSLRQIRIEARAANNSAVTYHFRDREDLVRAIWDHRLPALDTARRVILNEIARDGTFDDPAAVLRALVLPNYDLMDARGIHRYAAFVRHAMRWRQGALIRNAQLAETPASGEALALYHALRPNIPQALLDYRLRHATGMFYDMIVERDIASAAGDAVMPEAAFLAEGIGMMEAMCLRDPA